MNETAMTNHDETPRTDELAHNWCHRDAIIDLARDLERELRSLAAELEGSRAVNKVLRTDADQNCTRATAAEAKLEAIEEDFDLLADDRNILVKQRLSIATLESRLREVQTLLRNMKAANCIATVGEEAVDNALAPDRTAAAQAQDQMPVCISPEPASVAVHQEFPRGGRFALDASDFLTADITERALGVIEAEEERIVAEQKGGYVREFNGMGWTDEPAAPSGGQTSTRTDSQESPAGEHLVAAALLPGLERAAEICSTQYGHGSSPSWYGAVSCSKAIAAEIIRLKGEGS